MNVSLVAVVAGLGFLVGLIAAVAWPQRVRGLFRKAARIARHAERGDDELRAADRPLRPGQQAALTVATAVITSVITGATPVIIGQFVSSTAPGGGNAGNSHVGKCPSPHGVAAVIGMSLLDAQTLLSSQNFANVTAKTTNVNGVHDRVVDQDPTAGSARCNTDPITLVVAK